MLAGSVIALPLSLRKEEHLSIDVVLTDFEYGIPQHCSFGGGSRWVFAAFCADVACNETDETCCNARCQAAPHCLATMTGHGGCFQAQSTEQALLAIHSGEVSPVRERRWMQRSMSGRVCRLSGDSTCQEVRSNSEHILEFRGLRPDWLDNRVELAMSLALAEGDQQLYSNAEALPLKLGAPEVLEVLVNLTGTSYNDSILYFDATASVNEKSEVVVTLGEYPPHSLRNLTLYMAVLLPDPGYETDWHGSGAEMAENGEVVFARCEQSLLLKQRYGVCSGTSGRQSGWRARVVKVQLHPWGPTDFTASFQIQARGSEPWASKASSTQHSVTLQLDGVDSVGAWAVLVETTAGPTGRVCHFLAGPDDLSTTKMGNDIQVQDKSAIEWLVADPREQPMLLAAANGAACQLVRQKCSKVSSSAFGSMNITDMTCRIVTYTIAARYMQLSASPEVKSARHSGRHDQIVEALAERFVWSQASAIWHLALCLAEEGEVGILTCRECPEKRTHDLVCCSLPGAPPPDISPQRGPGVELSQLFYRMSWKGWPMSVRQLLTILSHRPTVAGEHFVNISCGALRKDSEWDKNKEEVEEILFSTVVEQKDLRVLNWTLRYCVPAMTPSRAKDLWVLSGQGVQVLKLVWDDFPQYLNTLMQSAIDDLCEPCLNTWRAFVSSPGECPLPSEGRHFALAFSQSDVGPIGQESQGRQILAGGMTAAGDFLSEAVATPCFAKLITHMSLSLPPWEVRELPTTLLSSVSNLLEAVAPSLTALKIDGLHLSSNASATDELFVRFGLLGKLRQMRLEAHAKPYESVQLPKLNLGQVEFLSLSVSRLLFREAGFKV